MPTLCKKRKGWAASIGVRQKAGQRVQPTSVLLTASYRERSMTGISLFVHPYESHPERSGNCEAGHFPSLGDDIVSRVKPRTSDPCAFAYRSRNVRRGGGQS